MDKRYVNSSNLVFDLGMNNGDDTSYYLKKDFRVVAVEASPLLVREAESRFAAEIGAGRLRIHHWAVWSDYADLPFFISKQNTHWSSLNSDWASRDAGETEPIFVHCVPLRHLFALHGVPMFLKIDIEGADEVILDQLHDQVYLPAYLSIEDCRFGFRYLEKLVALGYDAFKLSNQATVQDCVDTDIGHRFSLGSSGPFGEVIPGDWCSGNGILQAYAQQVRTRENERRSPAGVWWDIHARAPRSQCI